MKIKFPLFSLQIEKNERKEDERKKEKNERKED